MLDDEIAEQFALMGVTVTIASNDQPEPVSLHILPANHASFRVWLDCQTQWCVKSTMAGLWWQGLNYVAARLVIDDLDAPRHVFGDLRAMERVALPILNESL